MTNINFRKGDFGTLRIWTDRDAAYGSFTVVDNHDAIRFLRVAKRVGFTITYHTCDTSDECECWRNADQLVPIVDAATIDLAMEHLR